jgi:hypothetical protein
MKAGSIVLPSSKAMNVISYSSLSITWGIYLEIIVFLAITTLDRVPFRYGGKLVTLILKVKFMQL